MVALDRGRRQGQHRRRHQGHHRRRDADQDLRALDPGRRQHQGSSSRRPATRSTCSTPTTTSRPRSPRSTNMITKKNQVLIVASIDGTALTGALQQAKDGQHPGHRLRPPDPRHRRRRLLRHLRQLQGRRAAGAVARSRASRPSGQGRPVQRRAVRRLARTTTTPRSSSTARWRSCKPKIDDGTIKIVVRPDRVQDGRHPALGPGHRPEAHGGPAHQDLLRQAKVNGVLSPVRRPVARHHRGAEGHRLRQRRQDATRSSPARTPRSSRSSRSSPASSTPRSSRTPASSPRPRSRWSRQIARARRP